MPIEPPETVETDSETVACEGIGGALGHPRVFLTIGKEGYVDCPSCDRRGGRPTRSGLADGRYDFAFDSNRWIDEQQADPASAGLVFAWATTPKMLARLAGFAKLGGPGGGEWCPRKQTG